MKKNKLSKKSIKRILLKKNYGLAKDDERLLRKAIKRILGKCEKIVLKDVCEACGQPTKNFEIHPHCKEWWV